jgi:hypothetical protein
MPSRDVLEVVFRFPKSAEIRYLQSQPSVGDIVETRHGHKWMVSEVEIDEDHVCVATCVTPPPPTWRDRRHLLGRLTTGGRRE